jgi:hypothetical protein
MVRLFPNLSLESQIQMSVELNDTEELLNVNFTTFKKTSFYIQKNNIYNNFQNLGNLFTDWVTSVSSKVRKQLVSYHTIAVIKDK